MTTAPYYVVNTINSFLPLHDYFLYLLALNYEVPSILMLIYARFILSTKNIKNNQIEMAKHFSVG